MSYTPQKGGGETLWRDFELGFRERRWDKTSRSWVSSVPFIEPAGQPPPLTLVTVLETAFPDGAPPKGEITEESMPRAEIPEMIFREAVYWLHKAAHVLGASEKHIEGGLLTWSLSAGYQSAFFAARSVLAFNGIAVSEHDRASFVVDLCRDSRGLSSNKIDEIGAFEPEARIRTTGYLFGHSEVWRLFQRLLRVVKRSPWPEKYAAYFRELNMADLARQRHNLHYELSYWVMEDLFETVFLDAFVSVTATGTGRKLFDSASQNFSITLGLTVTQMAMLLFESMCLLTNRLIPEQELFKKVLSAERHPFFSEMVRLEPSAA